MQRAAFIRWTGVALACGGVLTILINAILTPLLPRHVPFAVSAVSAVFLWRQSASALAAAFLLFGSIGLYLRQSERAGRFGAAAFVIALVGSALVLGTEWNEVFVIRDLARRAPAALTSLDSGPHPSLYDLGAIIPLATFMIGWIALAIATFRARVLPRPAAALVIAGFFAIPLLAPAGPWGAVAGNAILGSGWIWLGYSIRNTSDG